MPAHYFVPLCASVKDFRDEARASWKRRGSVDRGRGSVESEVKELRRVNTRGHSRLGIDNTNPFADSSPSIQDLETICPLRIDGFLLSLLLLLVGRSILGPCLLALIACCPSPARANDPRFLLAQPAIQNTSSTSARSYLCHHVWICKIREVYPFCHVCK